MVSLRLDFGRSLGDALAVPPMERGMQDIKLDPLIEYYQMALSGLFRPS